MIRQGFPHTSIVSRVLIMAVFVFVAKEVFPWDRLSVGYHLGVPLAHDGSVWSVNIVYHILDVERHVLFVDDGRAEVVCLAHVGYVHIVVTDFVLELYAVLGKDFVHLFGGHRFDRLGLPVDGVLLLHEGDGVLGGALVEVPSVVGLVLHHGFGLDVKDIKGHSAHTAWVSLKLRSVLTVCKGAKRCVVD